MVTMDTRIRLNIILCLHLLSCYLFITSADHTASSITGLTFYTPYTVLTIVHSVYLFILKNLVYTSNSRWSVSKISALHTRVGNTHINPGRLPHVCATGGH